jgi:hypothetical protein
MWNHVAERVDLLAELGRAEKADVLAEEAVRRAQKTHGDAHPTTCAVLAGKCLDSELSPRPPERLN